MTKQYCIFFNIVAIKQASKRQRNIGIGGLSELSEKSREESEQITNPAKARFVLF